jgi:fido (protein-threonine AMPylation protein)
MKVFPSLSLLRDIVLPFKFKHDFFPTREEMIAQIQNFASYATPFDFESNCRMLNFFVEATCVGEGLNTLPERINLYSAWSFLCSLIVSNLQQDSESRGWLDILWLKQLHERLMSGLIDEQLCTRPGVFSLAPRSANYKGHEHFYPHFTNEKEWFDALQPVLDRFNALIQHVKQTDYPGKILDLCKCATWILYHIVSLHPFSDGNGRLSRFLASFVLTLFCPFPCAVFDIRESTDSSHMSFIDSIIYARDNHSDLSYLFALIIDSVWFSFLIYFANHFQSQIKYNSPNSDAICPTFGSQVHSNDFLQLCNLSF